MLPFLAPLVGSLAPGISSLVSATVTAVATVIGVTHAGKSIYKKGVKDGYTRCSKEYEEKLRKQADLFLKTTDKWKQERDAYEALLDEYELTIDELESQIISTNSSEYKQRLVNVKNYKRRLKKLAN